MWLNGNITIINFTLQLLNIVKNIDWSRKGSLNLCYTLSLYKQIYNQLSISKIGITFDLKETGFRKMHQVINKEEIK